jgi:hypothetical protein
MHIQQYKTGRYKENYIRDIPPELPIYKKAVKGALDLAGWLMQKTGGIIKKAGNRI